MGVRPVLHDFVQMGVVNVRVHSKEASHDGLDYSFEIFRKRLPTLRWKNIIVAQLAVYPLSIQITPILAGIEDFRFHPFLRMYKFAYIHEDLDILGRGEASRHPILVRVLPMVFKLGSSAHNRTASLRASIAHVNVEEIDLVEQVKDHHAHPVVNVIPIRDLDRFPQIAYPWQKQERVHFLGNVSV